LQDPEFVVGQYYFYKCMVSSGQFHVGKATEWVLKEINYGIPLQGNFAYSTQWRDLSLFEYGR
jgi:hypothetical protein